MVFCFITRIAYSLLASPTASGAGLAPTVLRRKPQKRRTGLRLACSQRYRLRKVLRYRGEDFKICRQQRHRGSRAQNQVCIFSCRLLTTCTKNWACIRKSTGLDGGGGCAEVVRIRIG